MVSSHRLVTTKVGGLE